MIYIALSLTKNYRYYGNDGRNNARNIYIHRVIEISCYENNGNDIENVCNFHYFYNTNFNHSVYTNKF